MKKLLVLFLVLYSFSAFSLDPKGIPYEPKMEFVDLIFSGSEVSDEELWGMISNENLNELIVEVDQTPLMLAISSGRAALVGLILKYGDVDFNVQNKQGYSAIFYAIITEQENLFWLLEEKGVELSLKDKRGLSLLDYAKSSLNFSDQLQNYLAQKFSENLYAVTTVDYSADEFCQQYEKKCTKVEYLVDKSCQSFEDCAFAQNEWILDTCDSIEPKLVNFIFNNQQEIQDENETIDINNFFKEEAVIYQDRKRIYCE